MFQWNNSKKKNLSFSTSRPCYSFNVTLLLNQVLQILTYRLFPISDFYKFFKNALWNSYTFFFYKCTDFTESFSLISKCFIVEAPILISADNSLSSVIVKCNQFSFITKLKSNIISKATSIS